MRVILFLSLTEIGKNTKFDAEMEKRGNKSSIWIRYSSKSKNPAQAKDLRSDSLLKFSSADIQSVGWGSVKGVGVN